MDLCELAQLSGASGDEEQVRNTLLTELQSVCDKLTTDSMGNIIAVKGEKKPGPRVMVAAHMDEPGLIISGIHETGLLYCDQVGSIDVHTLLGCRVTVGPNSIAGVIGGKPIHLLHGEERQKMPQLDDLFIDIGVDSKQAAEALVNVGDYATFATECGMFGDEMIKGKALASRSGCYSLLRLLSLELPYPLIGVFTVQKEIGLRGARIAGYRVNPDFAFIIDSISISDMPGVPEHQQGATLGAGPAINFSDKHGIPDLRLTRWIASVATKAGIPFQWQHFTTAPSDTSVIQMAQEGVRVAQIAIPCRYAGSPVNVVSMTDVNNTIELMRVALAQVNSNPI